MQSAIAEKIDDRTIQFVRVLPGPIERVWDYLYDGQKRGEWFASGDMPSKAGEKFTLHFNHASLSPHHAEPPEKYREKLKGQIMSNRLLAVEPPHRLVFEFDANDPNSSIVEFQLTPVGDNKVRFTLTHSNIATLGTKISVSGGWHSHLEILQYRAEGQTPPAFWDIWREAEKAYEGRYA